MRRWAIGVLIALLSATAWAVQCSQWQPNQANGTPFNVSEWFDAADAAANAGVAYQQAAVGSCNGGVKPAVSLLSYTDTSYTIHVEPCPGGIAANYTYGMGKRTGDYCTVQCQQGQQQSKLVTVGYVRATARADGAPWKTTDGRSFFAPVPGSNPRDGQIPTTICDGQCSWVADGAPSDWWVANDPGATGVYAAFRQQGYVSNGAVCSAATDQVNPAKPAPSCDGYVGQVNGKTTCIAKEPPSGVMGGPAPAGTGPKNAASAAAGAPAPSSATKNPDGSEQRFGPNGEQFERPGDKPSLMDTGGTGTGGGAGGTSTPSTGTSSTTQKNPDGSTTTSTTTMSLDLKTCGLPGNPACKIDESGTPDGKGYSSDATGKLGSDWDKLDGLLSSIQNKGDKDTSWSMPSWLPASSCTAWNLGTLPVVNVAITVDLCPLKTMIDGVISFFWLVGTFMAVLGMVSNVMMGPSKV